MVAAFGTILSSYRRAAGLSQAKLAGLAGLSRRAIADLERGARRNPYRSTVSRLADALRLDDASRLALLAASRTTDASYRARQRDEEASLPAAVSSIIGRDLERAEIVRLLRSERAVTLVGPGGVGKTRLAIAAAQHVRETTGRDVAFVDLAQATDQVQMATSIGRAVGLTQQRRVEPREGLISAIGQRAFLLVLDNCERVIQPMNALVEDLLSQCPNLSVLATSRQSLNSRSEVAFAIAPLAVDNLEGQLDQDALLEYAAVRLFVERAQARSPAFRITAANARSIGTLCARLDGLPLALELAAARCRALSVEQILGRLDTSPAILGNGQVDLPPRQRSVHATLDWSFALLEPAEQSLLLQLAVFAGSFDLSAVEAVCEITADTVDTLTALIDKSALLVTELDVVARYRLLRPVRQYLLERQRYPHELEHLLRRHAEYYLAFAETRQPRLTSTATALHGRQPRLTSTATALHGRVGV